MHLSGPEHSHRADEIIRFTLRFENQDKIGHTILLPGSQNTGSKLVYFSYYTVKDNFYTEVAREIREMNMGSDKPGSVSVKYLEPSGSVSIPVFLNDMANYHRHIEAHHRLPDLPPGEYKVLAWYDPWDEVLAQNLFNKIAFFEEDKPLDPARLNIPEEGLISNYITLIISAGSTEGSSFESTSFCDQQCKFCEAIEKGQWDKVAKIIEKQTFYNGNADKANLDSNWCQPHRNVAWLYHPPDVILLSLPSYTYRRFIFKNAEGYHYFMATWQLGIIYPTRSRINYLMDWMFQSDIPIRTSEVDYMKLIKFREY